MNLTATGLTPADAPESCGTSASLNAQPTTPEARASGARRLPKRREVSLALTARPRPRPRPMKEAV